MSRRRTAGIVYGTSVVFHAVLGVTMANVDPPPPPPPPPITIVMAEPEPEVEPPPKPPEPEPEPEPEVEPEPAPEAEPPEPEPESEPEPPPPPPRPRPAPSSPPPAAPAPAAPDFGFKMSGGIGGPGGLAVPEGDPNGTPGGGKAPEPARVVKKARTLAPKPEKAAADDGCREPATKPKPESMPQPEYTAAARAAGVEGKVRVRVTVGPDGTPSKVEVVQSLHPELDESAKQAVLEARFAPAMRCGEPVAATFTIAVRFSA